MRAFNESFLREDNKSHMHLPFQIEVSLRTEFARHCADRIYEDQGDPPESTYSNDYD